MCNNNYELCDGCGKYKLFSEFLINENLKSNICVKCLNKIKKKIKKKIKCSSLEEFNNQKVYK